jgi:hypothetical protein
MSSISTAKIDDTIESGPAFLAWIVGVLDFSPGSS